MYSFTCGIRRRWRTSTLECSCTRYKGGVEMLHAFLNSSLDGGLFIPSRTATDAVIDSESGWTLRWSGSFGREINLLPLPATEQMILGHPSCSLVTILTELQSLTCFKTFRKKFRGSDPFKILGKGKGKAIPVQASYRP
jgi:hypothetical protein